MAVLQIDNATRTWNSGGSTVRAVDDVSLTIDSGCFAAIQGPSGCGKSTLLLVAGGLLRPNTGTIRVIDQDIYAFNANQRARFRNQHIGFVFQQFHLVPYLSVLENVMAPCIGGGGNGDARDRAHDLLDQFGLAARLAHRPSQLSSGERQRTALARALLNKPQLVLADEPTGNLDSVSSRIVLEHLRRFVADGGAVLLVTHDADAAACADRQLTIHDGHLTETPVKAL